MGNLSQRVGIEAERSLAATSFDGTDQPIGSVLENPASFVIFDNQTDVSVPIFHNGTLFKTMKAGDVFPFDVRANHGTAPSFEFEANSQFSTNASVGTSGSIYISVVYAK